MREVLVVDELVVHQTLHDWDPANNNQLDTLQRIEVLREILRTLYIYLVLYSILPRQ